MPIKKCDADALLSLLRNELGTELSELHQILQRINQKDDWSFVIQAQAVIEAALTDTIVNHLGEDEITSIVERLPLVDDQLGKLTIAKKCSLISGDKRKAIKRLAFLRNKLAHSISYLDFDFVPFFNDMKKGELKAWRSDLLWFVNDDSTRSSWTQVFEHTPRTAVWLSVFLIASDLIITRKEIEGLRRINSLDAATSEQIIKQLQGADVPNS